MQFIFPLCTCISGIEHANLQYSPFAKNLQITQLFGFCLFCFFRAFAFYKD